MTLWNSMTRRAILGAMLAAAFASGGSAQDSLNYSGKTVELWVPFDTGGGTDRFVRMFQPFLSKYLPGEPDVVVLNKPGGASITASNQFHARAPKDGTAVLGISVSTLVSYALGNDQVKFDPLDWIALVVAPSGGVLYANAERTGVTGEDIGADIAKLNERPMLFGMKNPESAELRGFMAFDMVADEVKPIFGLGSSDRRQALFRNEVDLGYDGVGAYIDSVKARVDDGEVVPLFTFGYGPDLGRDPAMPDLPSLAEAFEAANGAAPDGIQWEAMRLMLRLGGEISKALVLPPETPQEVVDVYRTAMEQIVGDPEFQKLAEVELENYQVYLGEEAEITLNSGTEVDPEIRKWLVNYISEKFGIN